MDDYNQPYEENPYESSHADSHAADLNHKETRQWAMMLHLSQIANAFLWPAGAIATVVIWQIKKDELPGIDQHGRNATNWLISSFIYGLVCIPLIFVVVGIPLIIVVYLLTIIFPIIAAIKANDGIAWKYPLTISFL